MGGWGGGGGGIELHATVCMWPVGCWQVRVGVSDVCIRVAVRICVHSMPQSPSLAPRTPPAGPIPLRPSAPNNTWLGLLLPPLLPPPDWPARSWENVRDEFVSHLHQPFSMALLRNCSPTDLPSFGLALKLLTALVLQPKLRRGLKARRGRGAVVDLGVRREGRLVRCGLCASGVGVWAGS